jgi:hypothetical protein
MDYFDGMTDGKFKTDVQGRPIFYPWGALGRGYVLPDDSKKKEIRRFVKLCCVAFWPLMAGTAIFIGWRFSLIMLFLILLYYHFEITKFLKGIPVVGERLTFKEKYANSARSHNLGTLWMVAIFSALFFLSSIAIFLRNKDARLFGLACVIFFGASTLAHGFMIKLKMFDLGARR